MHELDGRYVTSWTTGNLPAVISVSCGNCGSREFFRPTSWASDGPCRYAHAMCPNCRDHTFFSIANYSDASVRAGGGSLFAHPTRSDRAVLSELAERLSSVNVEIQRDYQMAVQYFNMRDPAAVVLAARRMLEGMVSQFLPQDKLLHNLSRDLATLSKERDLSAILSNLSNVLKNAGNIGAHYGASRVTERIAEQALELSEELLQLHFLLEQRVERLKLAVADAQAAEVCALSRADTSAP